MDNNKFSNWREELLSEDAEFYRKIYNKAREQGANDIEARTIAAQGALETGHGKYTSGSFNYFGQKGTSSDNTSSMRTREVINGRSQMMNQPFKNYDSMDASIRDRLKTWRYKTRGAKSVEDAARRLQIPYGAKVPGSKRTSHGAYATDPNYAATVARIANEYGGDIKPPSPLSSLKPSSLWSKIKSFTKSSPKKGTKGYLNTPSSTRVLAKLKGKTGVLDKSTGKFTKRDWSSTESGRYKKYGGK
jgi:hypothetical protein|tara:strand:+ start:280 stop:1017 length:738 start_codon:yes stop_codon:yes gene_type:complete